MITITRKIEIYVNEPDKKKKTEYNKQLFNWLSICRKAANIISSHRFAQDSIKDFLYLTDNVKYKLANQLKDESGIFNTSSDNTCYRVLSNKYKGEIPMATMSFLNNIISKTYKEEKKEYYRGDRSLRSYKNNIPIPIAKSQFINWQENKEKGGNYSFTVFGIPFITRFGRDRSGNKIILERALNGTYKFCDSSLQYKKKKGEKKGKWFLLLVVQFEPSNDKLIKGKSIDCYLDVEIPIKCYIGKNDYKIGSKEEYLNHRLSIQRALRSRQMNARYNKGGHGRKKKTQSIEYFKNKEKNYINTKLHQYSAKLIQIALENKCSEIRLIDQKQKEKEAKEEKEKGNDFLLRNWSYYGLKEKIEYKAKKHNITVNVL